MTPAGSGTAARAVQWTTRNVGAGAGKVRKWDRRAGFAYGTAWCGIFLAAAMRAIGLKPPSGFAAAHNWSTYGQPVKRNELQPGDILVYGYNHVAMYIGGGQQVQGNNSDGTVGVSGIGSGLGLGPITAMRRPPYKGSSSSGGSKDAFAFMSPAERRKFERIAGEEGGNSGIPGLEQYEQYVEGPLETGGLSGLAGEVVSGIVGDLAKSAEPLMLNIGLIGGGAFLIYYGIALLSGSSEPTVKLFQSVKRTAAVEA